MTKHFFSFYITKVYVLRRDIKRVIETEIFQHPLSINHDFAFPPISYVSLIPGDFRSKITKRPKKMIAMIHLHDHCSYFYILRLPCISISTETCYVGNLGENCKSIFFDSQINKKSKKPKYDLFCRTTI